jgi:putative nucleotidyltransferase with HDIG domain
MSEAFRTRTAHAEVVDLRSSADPVIEVWAPLLSTRGRSVGAARVLLDESALEETVSRSSRTIWVAVGLVFGVLWLALALLVRGASSRLRRQNEDLQARSRELIETTRTLEATLIETIETLNAAVEARDPYTAGHSQRVRRVALAIGRELVLPTRQLGALATAALFHDIGKIGMPDSILTKPEPLNPAEAAVMREHAARGAEIVSRISSLQDSVPAIRHHHERWDGLGYPDGLRDEAIPIEAAIIALADAWDAMTTDRPYSAALQLNDAMLQVRAGREKQFNPAVVDAFWTVSRRRPADILPPQAPTAAVAVV